MQKSEGKISRDLIDLRRELHRIAELSGEEHNTSQKIKEVLKQFHPDEMIEGIGGNGLVATFEGEGKGPSVMIRCELDALPIPEENGISYRSENEGVSHKCGHDGHMAIVVGVARQMHQKRPQKGRVHLLFQPAEETGQGAGRVLNDEQFKPFEPDYIFALHNLPGYPLNQVVLKEGVFASASRGMVIKLKGETAHAAHPENGNSPALALSQLIQVFSSFPQFFTSLDEASKVTVIQAGLGEIAFGTSPGYAELRVTIRTHDNDLMDKLCKKAERVVSKVSDTYELEHSIEWTEIFEATVNDEECNTIIRKSAESSEYESVQKEMPFAWSEDFGRFTARYKGAMFGLGAGEDQFPLHSGRYDFPDELIETGITIFINIIDRISGLNLKE